jgi:hypothetical protein
MYDGGGGEMSVWWISGNATAALLITMRMTTATVIAIAGKDRGDFIGKMM